MLQLSTQELELIKSNRTKQANAKKKALNQSEKKTLQSKEENIAQRLKSINLFKEKKAYENERMSTFGVMNAKKSVLFAALAALPLAIASANAQAQSYEMVIATQLPEDMSNNEIYPALVHFKNLVEARTDGDLEVTIFGGGQLGSEVENGSEVQGGRTLQSTIMSAGAMSSFYGDYQAVTAPFLFTSWRQAWTFFDSEWFADFMSGSVDAASMRYLGTFDDGGGF